MQTGGQMERQLLGRSLGRSQASTYWSLMLRSNPLSLGSTFVVRLEVASAAARSTVMDQLSQADVRYLGVLVNHLAARITEGCLGVCTRQPEIPVSWS